MRARFNICLRIVIGATFCLSGACTQSQSDMAFDPIKWSEGDASVRRSMYADLRNSGVLVGKPRDEVIRMLGPADHDEPKFITYEIDDSNALTRLLTMDRIHMIVVFDDQGKVVTEVARIDR